MKYIAFLGFGLLAASAKADLQVMDDSQLADATGEGLGLVIEDFVFNSDSAVLTVSEINDASGNPVEIGWSELYIMGEGSQNGTAETPVDIGNYFNPWTISSQRGTADWSAGGEAVHSGEYAAIGDDLALLEFATSDYESPAQDTVSYVTDCVMGAASDCATRTAQRRSGADVGSRFRFAFASGREDVLDIDIRGMYVDGTHMRLWSSPDENGQSELSGNIRLALFAEELNIDVCNGVCNNTTSVLNIDNLLLDLNIGYGEIQPVKFSATSDGNFVLELTAPDPTPLGIDTTDSVAMQQFYDDYYANAPKSNIYIGNIQVGQNTVGETIVNGFRAQYFKITSMDL